MTVLGNVLDERLVDLQTLDRKALQVRERRKARAEVIDRQIDADRPQAVQSLEGLGLVGHQRSLGNFEIEHSATDSVIVNRFRDGVDERWLLELARRNVDRDPVERQAFLLPCTQLGARSADHPLADIDDQARLLGDVNEIARLHQPALWMLPPDERLGAGQDSVVDLSLRLVVQYQLSKLERAIQFTFEFEPRRRGDVHRSRVVLKAVLAFLLRVIHRGVGVLEQRLRLIAVERIDSDTDRRGRIHAMVADSNGIAHRVEDAVGHHAGFFGGADARKDDREFVAAQATDRVFGKERGRRGR